VVAALVVASATHSYTATAFLPLTPYSESQDPSDNRRPNPTASTPSLVAAPSHTAPPSTAYSPKRHCTLQSLNRTIPILPHQTALLAVCLEYR
ncbi:Protein of unknown function, partial [Gryllus bimaculatus]